MMKNNVLPTNCVNKQKTARSADSLTLAVELITSSILAVVPSNCPISLLMKEVHIIFHNEEKSNIFMKFLFGRNEKSCC